MTPRPYVVKAESTLASLTLVACHLACHLTWWQDRADLLMSEDAPELLSGSDVAAGLASVEEAEAFASDCAFLTIMRTNGLLAGAE